MQTYPTLYKKDSKGNVREWRMERINNQYRTVSGRADGTPITTAWTTVEGKNIGRANETTPAQQAESEVDAKYVKKQKTSYHPTLDTIDTAVMFEPMAAETYAKRLKFLTFGTTRIFQQPKLDGIRCIATIDGLTSRKGTPITAVPFIHEALKPLFDENPDLVLDGELYNHTLKDDFNEISSLVRKKAPTPAQILAAQGIVQYHVYDIPSPDLFDEPFEVRNTALQLLIAEADIDMLQYVPTVEVFSIAEIDEVYDKHIDLGYEGGIIRENLGYLNKRTSRLIKRKDFEDEEFTITRIEEGTGNWAGYAKRVFVTNNQGECLEFGAGMKGSKSYAKHVIDNKDSYIGKQATIQFFGRSKADQVPRHPIAKILHEDERW